MAHYKIWAHYKLIKYLKFVLGNNNHYLSIESLFLSINIHSTIPET